jgi:hypothetical protein
VLLRWCTQAVLRQDRQQLAAEDQVQLAECDAGPVLPGQVGADRQVSAALVPGRWLSGRRYVGPEILAKSRLRLLEPHACRLARREIVDQIAWFNGTGCTGRSATRTQ